MSIYRTIGPLVFRREEKMVKHLIIKIYKEDLFQDMFESLCLFYDI